MKTTILLICIFLFSCTSKVENSIDLISELNELPELSDNSSRCDGIDATKYNSLRELLTDFKRGQSYKDKYELNLRLGAFFIYQEEYDSALLFLNNAASIDSTLDYKLHLNKAICYSELGDFKRALTTVNKSIELCGNNTSPYANKAYYLGELGRCEEAIQIGLKLAHSKTEEVVVYGNLINCFIEMNELDSVRKYLRYLDENFNMNSSKFEEYKKTYL